MKIIYTLQHPQSEHHLNGMVGSWTDWDLSELGVQQAQHIALNLKAELDGKRVRIFSSDLKRAWHTAQIIGQALNVMPEKEIALRERNLGEAIDQSVAWLKANLLTPEITIDDRLFPSAQTRREQAEQLKSFWDLFLQQDDDILILVSHGDTLGVLQALWLGLETDALNSIQFAGQAGGVSCLWERDGKRIVRKFNDLSYLK
ncbi:histidine phosphatase family protein [Holdemania massiliensis]|uniref:Histidine phosphatase family protein n=1 Tax=Holdemania massiliensis TaxID=1468449 RepID=A0A6N7S2K9_9FIRM|nr:histidine phosphatase family protein [Holdemania massiliensis]MSA70362.1 histidine phosphatase family protein [Holdemania massiliensis]MSA88107.1 histidine phosphatase family protein [Holdemania massiliensis]MSB76936.1 histidine phosphatase family protein [Holdemania massiliensis]MSC31862.1 histidine phosphatase family protein [Holdemania massiliensis]MSC38182.1 histidine phosphatase family protein [Holdemania massiliensis]